MKCPNCDQDKMEKTTLLDGMRYTCGACGYTMRYVCGTCG